MSLHFAKQFKFRSAIRYVEDKEPEHLDGKNDFRAAAPSDILEGGGRTVFVLTDGSVLVAQLDPFERPLKRPCPVTASSPPLAPAAANTSGSSDSLIIAPAPETTPRRTFTLTWCYSPELEANDNRRVMFVNDVFRGLHHGLASNNICYRCKVPGTPPSPNDWVMHQGKVKSEWTTISLSDAQHQSWCASLLRSVFLTAPPAKIQVMPSSGLVADGVYEVTIKSVQADTWSTRLILENGATVSLKSAAQLVVGCFPNFSANWSDGIGWARFPKAFLNGNFQSVDSNQHYVLRGTIMLLISVAETTKYEKEFPEDVGSTLVALANPK